MGPFFSDFREAKKTGEMLMRAFKFRPLVYANFSSFIWFHVKRKLVMKRRAEMKFSNFMLYMVNVAKKLILNKVTIKLPSQKNSNKKKFDLIKKPYLNWYVMCWEWTLCKGPCQNRLTHPQLVSPPLWN